MWQPSLKLEAFFSAGHMASPSGTETEYCPEKLKGAAACCVCLSFVVLLSFSAGGWHLVLKAGTNGDRCSSPLVLDPLHEKDAKAFDDVCLSGGTERSHSSPLDKSYNNTGIYRCACCGEPLFPASTKFDSGTGWPSYWAPLEGDKIGYGKDVLGMFGVEVHCKNCGAHLGHVFDDGEGDTGYRYCINGVCLRRDAFVELPIATDVPWVANNYLMLLAAVLGAMSSGWLCVKGAPLVRSCLVKRSMAPTTVAEGANGEVRPF